MKFAYRENDSDYPEHSHSDRTGFMFLFTCLFILVFLLTGCTVNYRVQPGPEDRAGNNIIYLVKYASHSGIIIDRQKAHPYLGVFRNEFPDARYLEFGRGDLKWYKTQKDKRHVGLQVRALFAPTSSGIFVWSLPEPPEVQYPQKNLTKIQVSDAKFQRLVENIIGSFALDDENRVIFEISNMDKGGEYRIYKARGTYHLFKSCNNWVKKMFKESGIKVK